MNKEKEISKPLAELHSLAHAAIKQSRMWQAIGLFEDALEMATKQNDVKSQMAILFELGNTYAELAMYKSALLYYSKSLEKNKESKDERNRARTLINMATVLYYTDRIDEADMRLREALVILKNESNNRETSGVLRQLARIEGEKKGNYGEAEKLLKQSLEISQRLGNQLDIATSFYELGALYSFKGNYDEAEKSLRQALKIDEQIQNKYSIGVTFYLLGVVQEKKGNYDEAERMLKQSLRISQELESQYAIGATLCELGIIQYQKRNYDEAEILLRQSLELARKLESATNLKNTLYRLSLVLQEKGNIGEARRLLEQILEIPSPASKTRDDSLVFAELGRLSEMMKDYSSSKEYFEKALALLQKNPDKPNALRARKDLERILVKIREEATTTKALKPEETQ